MDLVIRGYGFEEKGSLGRIWGMDVRQWGRGSKGFWAVSRFWKGLGFANEPCDQHRSVELR